MLWAVLLYVGGIILVLAEFIVPGAVCGIVGTMSIIVSAVMACRSYPDYTFFIILGEALGFVVFVISGFSVLPKSRLGKRLVLGDSQQPESGWVAAETDQSLLGQQGEVLTALRPAGTIKVQGKRVDAVSDGQFIEQGAAIRVVEVRGSRVVVEEVARRVTGKGSP